MTPDSVSHQHSPIHGHIPNVLRSHNCIAGEECGAEGGSTMACVTAAPLNAGDLRECLKQRAMAFNDMGRVCDLMASMALQHLHIKTMKNV